jgi:hypothetical protein
MKYLGNSRLSRIGILSLMIWQKEKDALMHLPAETAAELDALLPAIRDRVFKGES